jgi:arginase
LPVVLAALQGHRRSAYVHVDLDVLDPSEGRVNSYSTSDGLSRGGVEWAIARITETLRVGAGSLTAFDPSCDRTGKARDAALALAVALVDAVSSRSGSQTR